MLYSVTEARVYRVTFYCDIQVATIAKPTFVG